MDILYKNLRDVQEVDLTNDRVVPGILKAFRGGFINQWQGTPDDIDVAQGRRLMRQTQGLESEEAK